MSDAIETLLSQKELVNLLRLYVGYLTRQNQGRLRIKLLCRNKWMALYLEYLVLTQMRFTDLAGSITYSTFSLVWNATDYCLKCTRVNAA